MKCLPPKFVGINNILISTNNCGCQESVSGTRWRLRVCIFCRIKRNKKSLLWNGKYIGQQNFPYYEL